MKLTNARVRTFRNIVDSTDVKVDEAVTCLVGKNESGKTAFLEGLYRLNPDRATAEFNVQEHYPAWKLKRDRQREDLDSKQVVVAEFALDAEDIDAMKDRFGANLVAGGSVRAWRRYDGEQEFEFDLDERAAVNAVVDAIEHRGQKTKAKGCSSLHELGDFADGLRASGDDGALEFADELEARISAMRGGHTTLVDAVEEVLSARFPKFFYFHEYSTLPGEVDVRRVLAANPDTLDDSDHTAVSLLRLAATDDQYLLNPDYETRKRELESVANMITQDILQYWSQNTQIFVEFDITMEKVPRGNGHDAVLDKLKIRIRDQRHWLSLPIDTRSSGFRWFFSFMAAFSAYENSDEPVIILLDEPGLGLHARAQKDFLRFIDERLATRRQVLFTTHSPFMVDPSKLDRVRVVEDKGVQPGGGDDKIDGSRVTDEVLSIDSDTLFPLQSALGYDIAQHLLVAPHNVVVEGTSDFTYLVTISNFLIEQGRRGLRDEWSILPVGGADLIPTFVALLGHHLDVTVVVDSAKGGNQKLSRLASEGYLSQTRLIPVGTILGQPDADIEDLFDVADYIALYNATFGASVVKAGLQGTDPIVRRIARAEGNFNHGAPADYFLRNRDTILPTLSATTLDQFEKLIDAINATFPS